MRACGTCTRSMPPCSPPCTWESDCAIERPPPQVLSELSAERMRSKLQQLLPNPPTARHTGAGRKQRPARAHGATAFAHGWHCRAWVPQSNT